MRRPSRSGLLLVYLICANAPLAAQNLESVGKAKPFSFAGGLSFNQIVYSGSGHARRDPYSYVAAGNVNLSLYGWAVPLSFTLSNHQTSFTQPFNQYAIHPAWKWITAHAGYTSVSFSPYTVNGHIFLGGAIDLAPEGKVKVSALYGRFVKGIPADSARSRSHPAFQRTGYGVKASYGDGSNFVNTIIFHACDDAQSIERPPDSLGLRPQENFVISVGAGRRLWRHISLKAEIASSALSKDITAEKIERHHPMDRAGFLFQPRATSSYYRAFKSSLDYHRGGWMLGLGFERIDPEYRTLGAYYFNNDLENIALNASGDLLKGKLSFSSSGGMQRDNLDKTKISTMRRLVGSLNVTWTPAQRVNFSASYSSFQTYTNIRSQFSTIDQLTPYDKLDTLDFTQIARNASVSGACFLGHGHDKTQNLSFNFSWQEAAEHQGQARRNSDTRFWNLTTAYTLILIPKKLTMTVVLNGTRNEGTLMHTSTWGPNCAVTKMFFQGKFRTTLASSFSETRGERARINTVMNARISGAFSMHRRHSVTLSAVAIHRTTVADDRSLNEFTGTLGYSYNFGTRN